MAFKRSGVQSPSSPPKKSTNHAGSRTCVVILFLAIFQKVIHLQAFYFAYRKPHWSWKDQCGSFFILLLPHSDSAASSHYLLFLTCNKAYLFRAAGIPNNFCTVRCDGWSSVLSVILAGSEGQFLLWHRFCLSLYRSGTWHFLKR